MTELLHEPSAVIDACDRARARGLRVGLVPTMGALHEGHLSLIDEAKRRGAGFVVVTIFVNPLQFGPAEDFSRYPRTLEADLRACAARGVEVVYAPDAAAMYPEGYQTHVEVGDLTTRLEGEFRPGHFRGVTTVVTKLFQVAQPCLAVFGKKDYQQLRVIERMTLDLGMRVEIVAHPIVREPDGLALSSRNRYLDPDQRARALAISRGLRAARDAFAAGERDAMKLEALVRAEVTPAFDRIDYIAVADPETLAPLAGPVADRALIAVAAHLGGTRLIDNTVLGEDQLGDGE